MSYKPKQRYFPELAGKLFYMDKEIATTEAFFVNKQLVGYCRDCGRRLTSRNTVPYPVGDDPTPVVLCPHCYDKCLS
jgi:hypothetical protein